jgi:hypothetical protein
MMTKRFAWLTVATVLYTACGGSSSSEVGSVDAGTPGADGGTSGDDGGGSPDGGSSSASNVAPVIVNGGPPGAQSVDVPFISVTICIPGTTTCQTIDGISVDTGSSGLRIISSVLSSDIVLPQATATTGSSLAECEQFDDGYTWGSVRYADVQVAGEAAKRIPLQIIGDPAFTSIPGDCSSSGPGENTVADFGGNGLIGINQLIPDCGEYCSDAANPGTGAYYSCSGSTCTAVAVAVADQVSNPIASFATDNNGAVLTFPTIAAGGAPTLSGQLIFGIGTQSNNGLGSATVQTLDDEGNFTTIFNGQTLNESFIDSGTNALSFNDDSITQCTGNFAGFYCPTSTVSLTAQNKGINGVMTTVSFSVANTQTLFDTSDTAFADLGGTGSQGSFDWGLPFFIGRSVFVGLDGASTPGGNGPYVAY